MTEPLTTGDVDALDELLASPGWALVSSRLKVQLERERDALERDMPEEATAKTRGAALVLRLALDLPAMMRDEIARETKGK